MSRSASLAPRRGPRGSVAGASLVAALVGAGAARAEEIRLDQIDVVSPSPVVARPAGQGATGAFPAGVLPVVTTTFSPVTVVTAADIAREQPRTLGDALFDRPGLSATTYAPGAASRPIIRG